MSARARAAAAAARAAESTGLAEVRVLERRLARVEEALVENAALAVPLEAHLARLEAALLPLLERAAPRR